MQEKKIQKRNTETKKKVHEALIELLKQKNIDKIFVSEICSYAQINRTTFYNHYGSQYDVIYEIVENYIDNTALLMKRSISEGSDFATSLLYALRYIEEHKEFMQILFTKNYYPLILGKDISLPQFDSIIIERQNKEMPEQYKKAISTFITQGIVGILVEWIKNGCMESAEKETELILFVLSKMAI